MFISNVLTCKGTDKGVQRVDKVMCLYYEDNLLNYA